MTPARATPGGGGGGGGEEPGEREGRRGSWASDRSNVVASTLTQQFQKRSFILKYNIQELFIQIGRFKE